MKVFKRILKCLAQTTGTLSYAKSTLAGLKDLWENAQTVVMSIIHYSNKKGKIFFPLEPDLMVKSATVFKCELTPGVKILLVSPHPSLNHIPTCAKLQDETGSRFIDALTGEQNILRTVDDARPFVLSYHDIVFIKDSSDKLDKIEILSEGNAYYGIQFYFKDYSRLIILKHSVNKSKLLPYKNIPGHKFSAMLFDADGDLTGVQKQ